MARNPRLSGLFPATSTPFAKSGELDQSALALVIERNVNQGAAGFFICGSAAECFLLTFEERLRAMSVAAEAARGTALIANISALSVDEALALGRHAKCLGYDAVATTAPFFYRYNQRAIAEYLRALRAQLDMALMLYNFPVNTGVEIELHDPDMRAVFTDGTLAGVKHTSLNLLQLERMIRLSGDITVLSGTEECFLAGLASGSHGAIGATFGFTLPMFMDIKRAFDAGDLPRARAMQARANDLTDVMGRVGIIPAIKHALRLSGIDCGAARPPFLPLTEAQQDELEAALNASGALDSY